MLKQLLLISSAIILSLALTACNTNTPTPPPSVTDTEAPQESSFVTETEAVTTEALTEPTTETEPLVIDEITTKLEEPPKVEIEGKETSYVLTVWRTDLMIFDDAGYDCGYVNALHPGAYTVIEEKTDAEGNVWGKLKSGIGWVDVTKAKDTSVAPAPIAVGIADGLWLGNREYHEFIKDQDASSQKLVIFSTEAITDVRFTSLDFVTDTYTPIEEHYTLPTLTADKPLMAVVAFHGDLTTYGISFVDAKGVAHNYAIYTSGRNGAVMLSEY